LSQNIRIYSENKAFYANIARSASNAMDLSLDSSFVGDPEWSSWLDWGKGYAGYTSNDGSVFIAVNQEYSENSNLITVYRREKQESYTVKSIPINREFLKLVNGEYRWIDFDACRARFLYDASGAASSFELVIINNQVIGLMLK
jgi:hypothetical protein